MLPTWEDLVRLSDAELTKLDIAQVNLACSFKLPHYHPIDVNVICKKLDEIAKDVSRETKRNYSLYDARPSDFNHSKARFRVLALITVLQRDLGIRYDADLINRDDFFQDPANVFIYGVLQNKRGTCTSLPPLVLAVGRRLGYPLKLVTAKSHLFARWDDPKEKFNIECTSLGFVSHPDGYYLRWPIPCTLQEMNDFAFLKSKTPREELACFMAARGHCFLDNLMHQEAAEAYAWANELQPQCRLHASSVSATLTRWSRLIERPWDTEMPEIGLDGFKSRFPKLPNEIEERFYYLSRLQVLDDEERKIPPLVNMPDYDFTEYTYTVEGRLPTPEIRGGYGYGTNYFKY